MSLIKWFIQVRHTTAVIPNVLLFGTAAVSSIYVSWKQKAKKNLIPLDFMVASHIGWFLGDLREPRSTLGRQYLLPISFICRPTKEQGFYPTPSYLRAALAWAGLPWWADNLRSRLEGGVIKAQATLSLLGACRADGLETNTQFHCHGSQLSAQDTSLVQWCTSAIPEPREVGRVPQGRAPEPLRETLY